MDRWRFFEVRNCAVAPGDGAPLVAVEVEDNQGETGGSRWSCGRSGGEAGKIIGTDGAPACSPAGKHMASDDAATRIVVAQRLARQRMVVLMRNESWTMFIMPIT